MSEELVADGSSVERPSTPVSWNGAEWPPTPVSWPESEVPSNPASWNEVSLPSGALVQALSGSPQAISPASNRAARGCADGEENAAQDSTRTNRRARTLTRTLSMYSVRYGVHSIQNGRREMEDAHCAWPRLGGIPSHARRASADLDSSGSPTGNAVPSTPGELTLGNTSFFAVFDGHGGARAAEFSGERLAEFLAEDRVTLVADPKDALRKAILRTEEEWLKLALVDELMDGTTAAVALLDRSTKTCVVGNVGDSEVLLGTRLKGGQSIFEALTRVHHLKRNQGEAERIAAVGGSIWRGRLGHPKINPQVFSLSVSRAIGDVFFKHERYTEGLSSGLIAEPWITSVEVCGEDVVEQFLVLGCDGLWDTVTYQKATDFVFEKLGEGENPQVISEELVNIACSAGSNDNITAMVVLLDF